MIPADVQAIVFDAVGTLLIPDPPAFEVYFRVASECGSQLTSDQVLENFQTAFRDEEEKDRLNDQRTSEERELQRWRRIVHSTLPDLPDRDACFDELYQHFADAKAWKLSTGIGPVIQQLSGRGHTLAIGSNYDHRLNSVVEGFPELRDVQHRFISSEVGWKKPSPSFFRVICDRLALAPNQILFIGDDLTNDYHAAEAAGFHSLLYDFNNHAPTGIACITSWNQLMTPTTD